MAFTIGNLRNIVSDFGESLNQIFGNNVGSSNKTGFTKALVQPQFGGVKRLETQNWLGNTKNVTGKQKLRYGFAIVTVGKNNTLQAGKETYFLDIPPQSITQKENFATNITATRKGILVESEGVVFKDITIKGTTGVFPGERAAYSGSQISFPLTSPPKGPSGVDEQTGLSKKSGVTTISGYQEFILLRQFFLKYAHDKVSNSGDRMLVFINEKDNQDLIVEPLEFTMERTSKSPLTYQYTIVLKCIGIFDGSFASKNTDKPFDPDFLEKVGNVSANLSAGLQQGRAAINATSTAFQRIFQAVDGTINGPLRQLQFALADLADGVTTVASLPETLSRNFTSTIAGIREFGDTTSATTTYNSSEKAKTAAEASKQATRIQTQLESNSRVPIPREFVSNTRNSMRKLTDQLADSFNMSDPLYNQIKGRVVTENPGPLKQVSDDEFLILGNMQNMTDSLNQMLATNDFFQSDVESSYDEANAAFTGNGVVDENFLNLSKPATVRQVRIRQNDTLERIAVRELNDASRWVELVILNRLKAPYLDAVTADGVKKYGDTILVPGA